jgi:CRISPR system Cascade subunit CasE
MYLSLLRLNLRSRRVQRELSNRYELHRTLMHAYKPEKPPEERLLYRSEEARTGINILVQTITRPDWSFFSENEFEGYLLDLPENPQMKIFDPVFSRGQQLVFRLQANPTRRLSSQKEEEASKRIGLYKEEDQFTWLTRKGQEAGFTPLDVRTTNLGLVLGKQRKEDQTHHIKMLGVQFDGILQVTDAAAFSSTLCSGIGSGKGFGFGLLSLARV